MPSIRNLFEANVFGLLSVTQAVAPAMMRRGSGTIVNVASVVGLLSTPFAGAYSASKAAVISLSDAMRMELAPFGVKVVVRCPRDGPTSVPRLCRDSPCRCKCRSGWLSREIRAACQTSLSLKPFSAQFQLVSSTQPAWTPPALILMHSRP